MSELLTHVDVFCQQCRETEELFVIRIQRTFGALEIFQLVCRGRVSFW